MKRSEIIFGLLRIPMDILAVVAALLLSYRLREANIDLLPSIQLLEPAQSLPSMPYYLSTFVWPGVLTFVVIAAMLKLYALKTTASGWSEIGRILIASALWTLAVMVWYFLIEKQLFYSRALLVLATVFIAAFVILGRIAVLLLQRACLRLGIGVRLVVSMGRQPIVASARETLARDVRYEYLGHVTDLASLERLRCHCRPDLVLQTDANPGSGETVSLIDYCRSTHIGYAFLPPVLADVPHLLVVEHLGMLPMLRFQPTTLDGWGRVLKRTFDIAASMLLLVLLSPLFLLIAFAIVLESGLPVWYVSRRVGEHGQSFIPVLKFRSMVRDADTLRKDLQEKNRRQDGPLFKIENDPRVTGVGRLLRRFDLDELPQLLNVLAGHLSLVGPRPHLPEEVNRYAPYQRRVFAVKPGMTGLAQISGRSSLPFDEEVRLDLKYVEEWSFPFDLWILARTPIAVLKRRRE
ncbi:MAG: exopolysaccharide biosynthesis polyprenyl glycosylphosphotransferase [Candidatus Peregrinibacteria bacterium]